MGNIQDTCHLSKYMGRPFPSQGVGGEEQSSKEGAIREFLLICALDFLTQVKKELYISPTQY